MKTRDAKWNWRQTALAVVGVWLLFGLLAAGQYSIAAWSAGQPPAWGRQVLRELPVWQVWSLLTLLVVAAGRRFPLDRGRRWFHLPVHVVGAVFCALIYIGAWIVWARSTTPGCAACETTGDLFWAIFRARFNLAFLLYWAVLGIYYAGANYRGLRNREAESARALLESARAREEAEKARAEAAETRAQLSRSRLEALRNQLHPHFLFNTLHSIASLMDEDVSTARRLIARLAELLRTVLESDEIREVRLSEELELLEKYVYIERVRYGGRLQVEYEIDADATEALVPPLLLQPLVENAIRHGIAPSERAGTVRIEARRQGGCLCLVVEDTGRGLDGSGRSEGIGLVNTRARLDHLYGAEHSFLLTAAPGRGASAEIEIPYRPASTEVGRDE